MGDLSLHDVPASDAATTSLVEHLVHRRFLGEYDDRTRAHAAADALVDRLGERLRAISVRVDGAEQGRVWLLGDGDDLSVFFLTLDDRTLGPGVRALVAERARAEGFRRLAVGVSPGDPVLEEFTFGGGFEIGSHQMRLSLDERLPAEDALTLVAMDRSVYEPYMSSGSEEYAEARMKAGESPERAREIAATQLAHLLPDGPDTVDHHFFVGEVDGQRVGTLWIGTERPMAFVYDVVVDEPRRREGHGAALMRAGALFARDHGAHALGLNVFGYNHGAKALYDGLGYQVVEESAALTL